jgi:hypothetical protein
MRWYRREVVWLIDSMVLAFMVFGVLWPLFLTGDSGGGPATDPVSITNYRADYTVDRKGQLTATETITGRFPDGRHGIFRYWDTTNLNEPRVRQIPRVTSVLMDGEPIDVEFSWKTLERFWVAKIGSPSRFLTPGIHVFEIQYTVPGVLAPGDIGADQRFASSAGDPDAQVPSVFFWDVVAPAWDMAIEEADISVTLPGEISGVECSAGFGIGRACEGLTVTGDRIRLAPSNLAPRTPVTMRAGVEAPAPPRELLPWSYRWEPILGRTTSGVLWMLGLAVAAAVIGTTWRRRTVEPSPGFPLQYAPPEGLGPVQVEYIRTESVPTNSLTATLLYLAERQLITMTQTGEERWTIRGIADKAQWDLLDPVSRRAVAALRVDTPGSEFTVGSDVYLSPWAKCRLEERGLLADHETVEAGKQLTRAKINIDHAVQAWAFDNKLLVKKQSHRWIRGANLVALVLALLGFALWVLPATLLEDIPPADARLAIPQWWLFPATMWGVLFAVFFIVTARAWLPGVRFRRTPAGRELWSRAEGFHRMLATDSAESRFDFAGRKDLYTAYIPFAVAAGVAPLWAKKYEAAMGMPGASTGLVSHSEVGRTRVYGRRRGSGFRQLRLGAVFVDRGLHPVGVDVQRWWWWWWRRARWWRRRVVVI